MMSNGILILYYLVDLVDEFGGKATMSERPFYDYVASNAINGDTGAQKSCAVMDVSGGYQSVWWKVWLQRNFNVAEIKIHFQPATIYWSTGFSIYVFDNESFIPPNNVTEHLVYHHDPSTGCLLQHMNITVHSTAHGIAFYNTRQRVLQSNCNDKNENRQFVEICEVNVLGTIAIFLSLFSFQILNVCITTSFKHTMTILDT
ncbi:uncharacterized protein LOC125660827 isoform X2 [Ostrea edulis]|uniref:uncharacterized protein LOC125660827 isoform X2 n=1 Tax=Ostrea edulis TaxID=37623 RepID=UPI0024AF3F1B|nr:uncharacterized protein LOC125660827 isoform X2 [Ostrea edulis]